MILPVAGRLPNDARPEAAVYPSSIRRYDPSVGSSVTPSWGGDHIVIHFKINGREFKSDRKQVRAGWLAEQVGLDPTGLELVRTTTGETWRDPSKVIELREGDAFEAKGRVRPVELSIRYTVNGELQVTKESPLKVEEILRRAGPDAAIDLAQLDDYYLDNVRTGVRYEDLSDEVPVADDDQFVALYAGPTPVA